MTLGGEMHHRIDLVFRKDAGQQSPVPDISRDKTVPIPEILLDILQTDPMPRIGQRVERDDPDSRFSVIRSSSGLKERQIVFINFRQEGTGFVLRTENGLETLGHRPLNTDLRIIPPE